MIINRQANKQDMAAVTAVWLAAFPDDTAEDCARFLALAPLDTCFVAEVDGAVVSMLFSIPATIGGKPFQYIYGAATHPAYRSRGLFASLLQLALETAKCDGYAGSFLHPAEPSLIAYYARFGYRPWTYCRRECGRAAGESALNPIAPTAYGKRRVLPQNAVVWPQWLLQYAAECGGAFETSEALLLCEKREDVLYIKEQFGTVNAAAVCAALGAVRYERVTESESGEVYTCVLPFSDTVLAPPYIGPVFD